MQKNLKKLTILHSNDLHGDFLAEKIDEKLIGGVSRLSGYDPIRKHQYRLGGMPCNPWHHPG